MTNPLQQATDAGCSTPDQIIGFLLSRLEAAERHISSLQERELIKDITKPLGVKGGRSSDLPSLNLPYPDTVLLDDVLVTIYELGTRGAERRYNGVFTRASIDRACEHGAWNPAHKVTKSLCDLGSASDLSDTDMLDDFLQTWQLGGADAVVKRYDWTSEQPFNRERIWRAMQK